MRKIHHRRVTTSKEVIDSNEKIKLRFEKDSLFTIKLSSAKDSNISKIVMIKKDSICMIKLIYIKDSSTERNKDIKRFIKNF